MPETPREQLYFHDTLVAESTLDDFIPAVTTVSFRPAWVRVEIDNPFDEKVINQPPPALLEGSLYEPYLHKSLTDRATRPNLAMVSSRFR